MSNRAKIISTAASHIGQRKLWPFAWCCRFVSQVYDEAGLSEYWYGGKTSLSCTTVLNWYKKILPDNVHTNLNAMRPGDIVLYNFKDNGKPNHIGIFVSKNGTNKFYAIEGNTSGTSEGSQYNGDTVAKKLRSFSKVFAFIHIVFPDENPFQEPSATLSRGSSGSNVKWLQYYLVKSGYDISIDGKFGPATQQALQQYQSKHSLSVDGKCGKQTRASLKEVFENDN